MKKLLIVFLALSVIGVFAFADDAAPAPAPVGQFHISNYGELFTYASVDGAKGTVGWGPGWDANPGIDQGWTFQYDGKDYGYAGNFEFGMSNITNGTTSWSEIKTFDAYFQLSKYVKFTAGQLDVTDYRWSTFIEGGHNSRFGGRQYAGMIQLYPTDGLSLAVLENVPGQTVSSPSTPPSGTTADTASYGTTVPADYQDWTNLAASYVMKDTGKFYVAWNNTKQEFAAGANISAVKPFTFLLVYDYDYDSKASTNASTVWGSASYSKDALAVALDLGVGFGKGVSHAYDQGYDKTAFAFELNPEYTMGKYALGALLGYDNGQGLGLFGGQAWGWDGAELYPYVKANFDNGSFVQVGVLYASGSGVVSPVYGDAVGNGGKSLFAIPITYSLSF
jgi:hypothetical protein